MSQIISEDHWKIMINNSLNNKNLLFKEENNKIVIFSKKDSSVLITIDLLSNIVTTLDNESQHWQECCIALNAIRSLIGSFRIVW